MTGVGTGARRPAVAVGLVLLALLPAGCVAPSGDPGTPSASAAPAAADPAARTLTGAKKATGQTLPTKVAGWTLTRRQTAGGAASAFYVNPAVATELVATLTPVSLTDDALAHALTGAQDVGGVTCGTLAGAGATACYLPLDGGNLRVAGALPVADLAAFTQGVYDTLG